ncbi:MAG: hypothetical protein LC778_01385 [Acidobacteria bacterium]|nr:hypothetical protein [Acidobacteriota bacterium]
MKLTFLGTGTSTGVPSIACNCETCVSNDPRDKRLRVSVLIEHAGKKILVDTSSDFRQQALRRWVFTLMKLRGRIYAEFSNIFFNRRILAAVCRN